MKYLLLILLFVSCKNNKFHDRATAAIPAWSLVHDKEKDQWDIVFKDTTGVWNTVKINWEIGTALIITDGNKSTQTIEVRLKHLLYNREQWSSINESPFRPESPIKLLPDSTTNH